MAKKIDPRIALADNDPRKNWQWDEEENKLRHPNWVPRTPDQKIKDAKGVAFGKPPKSRHHPDYVAPKEEDTPPDMTDVRPPRPVWTPPTPEAEGE